MEEETIGRIKRGKISPAKKKWVNQVTLGMIEDHSMLVEEATIEEVQEAILEVAQEGDLAPTQEVKDLVFIVERMVTLKLNVELSNMHKA